MCATCAKALLCRIILPTFKVFFVSIGHLLPLHQDGTWSRCAICYMYYCRNIMLVQVWGGWRIKHINVFIIHMKSSSSNECKIALKHIFNCTMCRWETLKRISQRIRRMRGLKPGPSNPQSKYLTTGPSIHLST